MKLIYVLFILSISNSIKLSMSNKMDLESLDFTSFKTPTTGSTQVVIKTTSAKDAYLNIHEVYIFDHNNVKVAGNRLKAKLSPPSLLYSTRAANCINGNLTDLCHSQTTGATLTIDVPAGVTVSRIVIFNWFGFQCGNTCAIRIVGATVKVVRVGDQKTLWMATCKGIKAQYLFNTGFPSPTQVVIKTTSAKDAYLNIRKVYVFDQHNVKVAGNRLKAKFSSPYSSVSTGGNGINVKILGVHLTIDIPADVTVSRVKIYNRDGNRKQNTIVKVVRVGDQKTLWMVTDTGNKSEYDFKTLLPSPTQVIIKSANALDAYLNIREVYIFDQNNVKVAGNRLKATLNTPFNFVSTGDHCINGNLSDLCHSENIGGTLIIDVPADVTVSRVKIFNRINGHCGLTCTNRILGTIVKVVRFGDQETLWNATCKESKAEYDFKTGL